MPIDLCNEEKKLDVVIQVMTWFPPVNANVLFGCLVKLEPPLECQMEALVDEARQGRVIIVVTGTIPTFDNIISISPS